MTLRSSPIVFLLIFLASFFLASCTSLGTGKQGKSGSSLDICDVDDKDANRGSKDSVAKSNMALREEIIRYAATFLGTRYRYGGKSPKTGFDCSGFTSYVFRKFNYQLNIPSGRQYAESRRISRKQLLPGDLVFFGSTSTRRINHVAIYAGNNRIIHAPSSGKVVEFANLSVKWYDIHYIGSGRILPD